MEMITIKKLAFVLLILIFSTAGLSYTIEQVLSGVERTTFEEFSIPYFKWFSALEGELRAGYDPFEKNGILSAAANIKMFEKLDLTTSFAYSASTNSDSNYKFSLGVSYDFLGKSDSEKRYKEALKEATDRQLEAVELFFDYLKKKVMLDQEEQDVFTQALKKLDQVDMAYTAIKIEALSSLPNGEPQISGLSNYIPDYIDEDIVETAVLRYVNLFSSAENDDDARSLYAILRTDYNDFLQGLSAGIGGKIDFDDPVFSSVDNKINEIDIRKNKLYHDVLTQIMPELKAEYERLETAINNSTSKIIRSEMSKEELSQMQQKYKEIENKYIELTLEAVKLEYIFVVLSGIAFR